MGLKRLLRIASAIFLFSILLLGYSNCSQQMISTQGEEGLNSEFAAGDGYELGRDLDEGQSFLIPTATQYVQCKFISVDTIRAVLRDQLGLIDGDVEQFDEAGNLRKKYVDAYSVGLGQGDMGEMTQQLRDDHVCNALKFKLAMEIFMEGCAESMDKPKNRARLFPNGAHDVSTAYLAFTGREPTKAEASVLSGLADSVSGSMGEAAVCAAILTSVEVLDRS